MTADTIRVRYIGLKAKCTDSFPSGSIHTWIGAGDVQTLPASALAKVVKHPTVWELVADEPEGETLADAAVITPPAEPKYVLVINETERVVLDTIDIAGLKDLALKLNVPFNARTKDPLKLAAEIFTNATKES